MARARVWVRPGMFPATITVAPNSPSARLNPSTAAAASPRPARGIETFRSVLAGDARGPRDERKAHDGGGDDRPLPGEEEIGIESEGAASEGPVDRQEAEQHVADGRRRQHEGERDDRLGDPLP